MRIDVFELGLMEEPLLMLIQWAGHEWAMKVGGVKEV